jgi:uncharacterized protein
MTRPATKPVSIHNVVPNTSGSVTVCITQKVKHGHEKDFESWLTGIAKAAERFPGHQRINVLRPGKGSQEYTYIFRFDSYEHLQKWESSSDKDLWISKSRNLTEIPAKKQILTGLEYWFTLPGTSGRPAPSRYKMALLTVLAIYPLTTMLGYVMTPGPFSTVRLLKGLAVSIIAVTLMTYVVMPRVTRLFAGWLFGGKEA